MELQFWALQGWGCGVRRRRLVGEACQGLGFRAEGLWLLGLRVSDIQRTQKPKLQKPLNLHPLSPEPPNSP